MLKYKFYKKYTIIKIPIKKEALNLIKASFYKTDYLFLRLFNINAEQPTKTIIPKIVNPS